MIHLLVRSMSVEQNQNNEYEIKNTLVSDEKVKAI